MKGLRPRLVAAAFAPALLAPAALAAEAPDVQLTAWIAQATDLAPAQVALVTPDRVFSLEPLGPPLATGEVIALMRAEARDAAVALPGPVRSWDAHLLFDCKRARLRVIRSASFPEHNRKGRPQSSPEAADWQSPGPEEPAARLMAAACETDFAWPLRASSKPTVLIAEAVAPPPPSTPQTIVMPVVEAAKPAAAPVAPPAAPPAASASRAPEGFAVQVARGPSEDGAKRALDRARKTLGAEAKALTTAVEPSKLGRGTMRYTAVLGGFETADLADRACEKLHKADQTCFRRGTADAAEAAGAGGR